MTMASGKIKTLRNALLAVLGGAAASGLLATDAAARVLAREDKEAAPLLLAPSQWDASELLAHGSHRSHRSHSSHRSHASGSSHYSGGRSYYPSSGGGSSYTPPAPKPVPPKPAKVSLVALPGGSIFVDGKSVGEDETDVLTLKAGDHVVRVENRFLGDHEVPISLSAGQSGTVKIEW
jgi:hypothetical protein